MALRKAGGLVIRVRLPASRKEDNKKFMAEKRNNKNKGKFFIVSQTEEEIERNRKTIEELRKKGLLEKYEKTFKFEKDGTITKEN